MGQPEQLAKRTFAEETKMVTRGALAWQDPPEIGLVKVQGDGYLRVLSSEPLAELPWPWPEAAGHEEVLLEIKMAGDHLDEGAVERALLRRQARQVQRVEEAEPAKPARVDQEPLWILAPHVPEWLVRERTLALVGAGCYRVEPSGFPFLWIAANELPLQDELVPFLMARSGRALDAFARWIGARRPTAWVLDMVECLPMSTAARDELLLQQVAAKKDDPEVEARRQHILRVFLEHSPEVRKELILEGELKPLVRQFERRLARALAPAERAQLAQRVREQGAERVGDLVLDLTPDELAAWLAATRSG
ncbi:hypothetical protein [Polyangium aurulentum]|uniref:hypothetical protein n=1 Tax=Polyangium aurulentum TaxID=2567896 RepID=UPI0010AE6630|nr:hypothetical protein [Polyangium aurulentum]UQA59019.1 hypothetical protein E8A73_000415 [Polyangium aurulentum]